MRRTFHGGSSGLGAAERFPGLGDTQDRRGHLGAAANTARDGLKFRGFCLSSLLPAPTVRRVLSRCKQMDGGADRQTGRGATSFREGTSPRKSSALGFKGLWEQP